MTDLNQRGPTSRGQDGGGHLSTAAVSEPDRVLQCSVGHPLHPDSDEAKRQRFALLAAEVEHLRQKNINLQAQVKLLKAERDRMAAVVGAARNVANLTSNGAPSREAYDRLIEIYWAQLDRALMALDNPTPAEVQQR